MTDLKEISRNIQSGNALRASELINRALDENCGIENILKKGLWAGMAAAEERYGGKGPCTPEMLGAVHAANRGRKILQERLRESAEEPWGTVIIGTIKGDIYDVEKNFISLMMEIAGLRVVDMGVSVNSERFIGTAKTEDAQLIACSASMLSTMGYMKNLVQTADAAGIRNQVKILITGKPVTEQYRAAIGADFYAPDAESAAEIAAAHCRHTLRPAA